MDDYLEENPIIIALQIICTVFFIIALLSSLVYGYNKIRARAVFQAELPNHLLLLRNRDIPMLGEQTESEESPTIKDATKIKQQKYKMNQTKYKNFLPTTPYGIEPSISPKENISNYSKKINQLLEEVLQNPENVKIENANTTKDAIQPRPNRNSEKLRQIQNDAEKNVQEGKEQSKKKKEEEEKKKQENMEQKTEVAEEQPKKRFTFGKS